MTLLQAASQETVLYVLCAICFALVSIRLILKQLFPIKTEVDDNEEEDYDTDY